MFPNSTVTLTDSASEIVNVPDPTMKARHRAERADDPIAVEIRARHLPASVGRRVRNILRGVPRYNPAGVYSAVVAAAVADFDVTLHVAIDLPDRYMATVAGRRDEVNKCVAALMDLLDENHS